MRTLLARRALLALVGCTLLTTASAQYAFDPSAADEHDDGIRFFGSAKDNKGGLVSGATIMISSDTSVFTFVTDDLGRFRGNLPPDTVSDKIATKCWKVGFRVVSVTKRNGPAGAKPSVQVDCLLQASAAASN